MAQSSPTTRKYSRANSFARRIFGGGDSSDSEGYGRDPQYSEEEEQEAPSSSFPFFVRKRPYTTSSILLHPDQREYSSREPLLQQQKQHQQPPVSMQQGEQASSSIFISQHPPGSTSAPPLPPPPFSVSNMSSSTTAYSSFSSAALLSSTAGTTPSSASSSSSLVRHNIFVQDLLRSQTPLLVIEYQVGWAAARYRYMRRSEILFECRGGTSSNGRIPAAEGVLLSGGGGVGGGGGGGVGGRITSVLQSRDLRVVDPEFDVAREPALLVRRHCIVVSLPPVRAIILYNRCLFFPQRGADAELMLLLERFAALGKRRQKQTGDKRGSSDTATNGTTATIEATTATATTTSSSHQSLILPGEEDAPFEFYALETFLLQAVASLSRTMSELQPNVTSVVTRVSSSLAKSTTTLKDRPKGNSRQEREEDMLSASLHPHSSHSAWWRWIFWPFSATVCLVRNTAFAFSRSSSSNYSGGNGAVSLRSFENVRVVKRKLGDLVSRVKAVHRVLSEALDTPEDIASMALTAIHEEEEEMEGEELEQAKVSTKEEETMRRSMDEESEVVEAAHYHGGGGGGDTKNHSSSSLQQQPIGEGELFPPQLMITPTTGTISASAALTPSSFVSKVSRGRQSFQHHRHQKTHNKHGRTQYHHHQPKHHHHRRSSHESRQHRFGEKELQATVSATSMEKGDVRDESIGNIAPSTDGALPPPSSSKFTFIIEAEEGTGIHEVKEGVSVKMDKQVAEVPSPPLQHPHPFASSAATSTSSPHHVTTARAFFGSAMSQLSTIPSFRGGVAKTPTATAASSASVSGKTQEKVASAPSALRTTVVVPFGTDSRYELREAARGILSHAHARGSNIAAVAGGGEVAPFHLQPFSSLQPSSSSLSSLSLSQAVTASSSTATSSSTTTPTTIAPGTPRLFHRGDISIAGLPPPAILAVATEKGLLVEAPSLPSSSATSTAAPVKTDGSRNGIPTLTISKPKESVESSAHRAVQSQPPPTTRKKKTPHVSAPHSPVHRSPPLVSTTEDRGGGGAGGGVREPFASFDVGGSPVPVASHRRGQRREEAEEEEEEEEEGERRRGQEGRGRRAEEARRRRKHAQQRMQQQILQQQQAAILQARRQSIAETSTVDEEIGLETEEERMMKRRKHRGKEKKKRKEEQKKKTKKKTKGSRRSSSAGTANSGSSSSSSDTDTTTSSSSGESLSSSSASSISSSRGTPSLLLTKRSSANSSSIPSSHSSSTSTSSSSSSSPPSLSSSKQRYFYPQATVVQQPPPPPLFFFHPGDAAEVLLESYLQEVETVLSSTKLLRGEIEGAEAQMSLMLADARNQLLRVEIGINTISLGFAFCTVIAGFFGMNVTSHQENNYGTFIAIAVGCSGAAVVLVVGIALYLRRYLR